MTAAPTDGELAALVAEHVAGWTAYAEKRGEYTLAVSWKPQEKQHPYSHWDEDREAKDSLRYRKITCLEAVKMGFFGVGFPPYATSADAVIPLLEKWEWQCTRYARPEPDFWVHVGIGRLDKWNAEAHAPTFARASCLALLRAHGVTGI